MKQHNLSKTKQLSSKYNKKSAKAPDDPACAVQPRRRRVPGLLLFILLLSPVLVLGACSSGLFSPAGDPADETITTSGPTDASVRVKDTTVTTSTAAPGTEPVSGETDTVASVQRIGADQALSILEDHPDAVLVDVRTPEEFAEGYIAGAVLLPVDEIKDRLNELPSDPETPIVLYCRSGRRSALAAEMLIEAGYRLVYDLGGILSWPYELVKD